MMNVTPFLPIAVLCSGCASSMTAVLNRPVFENSVEGAVSTVSLAADRRTVVIVTEGPNRSKFCAEPPPDTASALKTDLDATIKANVEAANVNAKVDVAGGIKDKSETTITVLAERTAALDAFRTGVYALCQFHLNGAIAKEDVKPIFITLIESFASIKK